MQMTGWQVFDEACASPMTWPGFCRPCITPGLLASVGGVFGRLVHYANVNSGKAAPPPSLYVTLCERRSSLKICLTMTVELAPAVVTAVLVAPALNSSICPHTLTPHTPHFRRAVEPHVAASASTGPEGAVEGGVKRSENGVVEDRTPFPRQT